MGELPIALSRSIVVPMDKEDLPQQIYHRLCNDETTTVCCNFCGEPCARTERASAFGCHGILGRALN